jgi:hypothetical protein
MQRLALALALVIADIETDFALARPIPTVQIIRDRADLEHVFIERRVLAAPRVDGEGELPQGFGRQDRFR